MIQQRNWISDTIGTLPAMSKEVVKSHEEDLREQLQQHEDQLALQVESSQGYWTDHVRLDEQSEAIKVRLMNELLISISVITTKIQELRSEITEIHLTKVANEALTKIEGYSENTRDAIEKGKTTNWIMVGIAGIMLLIAGFTAWMAYLTYQNSMPAEVSEPIEEAQVQEEGST